MKKLKALMCLSGAFALTNGIGSPIDKHTTVDMEVLDRHGKIIESLKVEEPTGIKKLFASLIRTKAKGKMTEEMINYFSHNPIATLAMYQASKEAEMLSREFCKIPPGEKRRTGDEVDAVRHFIWSGLLSMKLDEQTTLEIQSLQENRAPELDHFSIMDLHNNELGLKFVEALKDTYGYWEPRNRPAFIKNSFKNIIFSYLKSDLFFVINSQPSACQFPKKKD